MTWPLDQIDSWLNRRDTKAVEDELLVIDAAEAPDEMVVEAQKMEGVENEAEARQMIGEAKAYGREFDIAESDADPDELPKNWKRRDRRDNFASLPDRDDMAGREDLEFENPE